MKDDPCRCSSPDWPPPPIHPTPAQKADDYFVLANLLALIAFVAVLAATGILWN